MCRWYTNHCGPREKKIVSSTAPVATKLRATNALELWGHEHTEEVALGVAEKMSEGDIAGPGANLKVYWDVKRSLFDTVSEDEKERWVACATEHNERLKEPPTPDYIEQ